MTLAATTDAVLPAPAQDATLDDLFVSAALRRPAEIALVDPPNRRLFGGGMQRYLSYAAADRMVSAIAGRLHGLDLPRGSAIGLQVPNLTEGVLALLAILRAGMVAAPLPLLWRRADIVEALGRVGAKAIIAGGRIGQDELCNVALHAAAAQFSVRYVCGFGENLPDGAISLGELLTADRLEPLPDIAESGRRAEEIAVVTWETTAQGNIAVARSHAQLIAGGLAAMHECDIAPEAKILAALHFGSFGGLALSVLPWLLVGGSLVLHHAFMADAFAAQCGEHDCDTVVVPGPLAAPLLAAGLFPNKALRRVIAAWRAPERVAASPPWPHATVQMVDVQLFGEIGFVARRRSRSGLPESSGLNAGTGARDGDTACEAARTGAGTLALRGPMVPREPYPSDRPQRNAPVLTADAAGFVDTGYPCRIDPLNMELRINGPPAGIVDVGGYRFAQRSLQDLAEPGGAGTSLTALPHSHLSHRLAGKAADRAAARTRLAEAGANALATGAFRDRRKPRAA